VKTAELLIEQAGGVKQARQAFAEAIERKQRAAKSNRKAAGREKGGRPETGNDLFWLHTAADLARKYKLKKTAAIKRVATVQFPPQAKRRRAAFVNRLLRKLGKQPLSNFSLKLFGDFVSQSGVPMRPARGQRVGFLPTTKPHLLK
jgi:hypothetical protein